MNRDILWKDRGEKQNFRMKKISMRTEKYNTEIEIHSIESIQE